MKLLIKEHFILSYIYEIVHFIAKIHNTLNNLIKRY